LNDLRFKIEGRESPLEITNYSLVIAGFTGSDPVRVERHLSELREQGVVVPNKFPVFYPVPSELAVQNKTIEVSSERTSGEIEPVLIISKGQYYITLGSDHTDREIEKTSISMSKASCSKPLSDSALPLETVVRRWDNLIVRSETLAENQWRTYQVGRVNELIQPLRLLALMKNASGRIPDNLVMFLGTVPIQDGRFIFSTGFRGSLGDDSSSSLLGIHYEIKVTKK